MARDPGSEKARALVAAGAEVVKADMDDPASLDAAFAGAHGVYSVQNPMICGLDGEVRQGRNVGDAAGRAGVRHLVYGSAGTGERGTGIGSWESKLDIEDHLRELGLPVTILRPPAFMEVMTDPAFYPAAGVWHVWPKIAGGSFRASWLSCHDLGVIAAKVFADADRYVGQQLELTADLVQPGRVPRALHEGGRAAGRSGFPCLCGCSGGSRRTPCSSGGGPGPGGSRWSKGSPGRSAPRP